MDAPSEVHLHRWVAMETNLICNKIIQTTGEGVVVNKDFGSKRLEHFTSGDFSRYMRCCVLAIISIVLVSRLLAHTQILSQM